MASQASGRSSGIRTLAFMDLETTDLPHAASRVRVTEVAVVAVSTADLLAARPRPPRVQHKVTLCVDPRLPIHPTASKLTGLDNFLLEGQPYFDETTCATLETFLGRLQHPVCLLAHNGHIFDFPMLAKEFKTLNRPFPNDMLCADTLHYFRQALNGGPSKPTKAIRRLNFGESTQLTQQKTPNKQSPKKSNLDDFDSTELDAELSAIADAVELSFQKSDKPIPATPSQLAAVQEQTPQRRTSYRLGDVVDRLVPEFQATALHSAEGDVMALLHCAAVVAQDLVPWVNENARPFPQKK
ncbi:three-prime repair exonuclease 1 [Neocloeon triangulifer]|uniref:three-prime repair exonuclease 1 n=1 Tax=Neocloeon triangulifer TaxID=2078957 RepID=UPI00286EEB9A|nr:three-prime repair exonuclease 1 [Neocloeon triangulifer]